MVQGRPSHFRLTPRERECVYWVGLAANNAEIARRMVLAVPSVENLITHIFAKLHLQDDPRRQARVRLARWAWEHLPVRETAGRDGSGARVLQ